MKECRGTSDECDGEERVSGQWQGFCPRSGAHQRAVDLHRQRLSRHWHRARFAGVARLFRKGAIQVQRQDRKRARAIHDVVDAPENERNGTGEHAHGGKYYIFANITWESPIGSGLWGLRLWLNGKTVIAEQTLPNTSAPFRISMSVGTLYALGAGDYVEVQVFQNNGNPLMIRHIPATSPEFGMAKVP
jgi:hypothetical protein